MRKYDQPIPIQPFKNMLDFFKYALSLGNFPKDFKLNTLPMLIERAASQCYEVDSQHRETICDSGWIEYITKEVGKKDTDKILW